MAASPASGARPRPKVQIGIARKEFIGAFAREHHFYMSAASLETKYIGIAERTSGASNDSRQRITAGSAF